MKKLIVVLSCLLVALLMCSTFAMAETATIAPVELIEASVVGPLHIADDGSYCIVEGAPFAIDVGETKENPVSTIVANPVDGYQVYSEDGFFAVNRLDASAASQVKLTLFITYSDTIKKGTLTVNLCEAPVEDFNELPDDIFVGNVFKVCDAFQSRCIHGPLGVALASLNEEVATVDFNGNLHALAPGETTLSFTNYNGKLKKKKLTIKEADCDLAVSVADSYYCNGQFPTDMSIPLIVKCSDATAKIEYALEEGQTIATITSGGQIKATYNTQTTVIVKAIRDGAVCAQTTFAASFQVPITDVRLDKVFSGHRGAYSQNYNMTEFAIPADGNKHAVKWTSSDESIFSIDEFGIGKGKGIGEVTITATGLYEEWKESLDIVVDLRSSEVQYIADETPMHVGDTRPIKILTGDNHPSLTYVYTVDKNYRDRLHIDENGYATGLRRGKAYFSIQVFNQSGDEIQRKDDNELYVYDVATVTDIADMPKEITMQYHETIEIAKFTPSDGVIDGDCMWLSDPEVVSINTRYLDHIELSSLKIGETDLVVTLPDGKTYSCKIKVLEPRVSAQILKPSDFDVQTFRVGDSYDLKAIDIVNKSGNAYTLDWTLDGGTVYPCVSVSKDGKLKALHVGTGVVYLTITDSVTGEYYVSEMPVEVTKADMAGFKVPTDTLLSVGGSDLAYSLYNDRIYLDANLESDDLTNLARNTRISFQGGAENEAYWAAHPEALKIYSGYDGEDDEDYAYLDFYYVRPEPFTVTLLTNTGMGKDPVECKFTVNFTLGVPQEVSMKDVTVQVGASKQMEFLYKSYNSDGLHAGSLLSSFKVKDERIATVSDDGVITAVAEGSTTVQATITTHAGTKTCEAAITVVSVPLTSIAFAEPSIIIPQGYTTSLAYTASDDRALTFSSSAPAIAAVNGQGGVSGIALGEATIEVTGGKGGPTATCKVTVVPSAAQIVLNGGEEVLYVQTDRKLKIDCKVSPKGLHDEKVHWDIIYGSGTVDEEGYFTSASAGTVYVRAACGYANETLQIVVYEPVSTLTTDVSGGVLLVGEQLQLTFTDQNGKIVNNSELLWESSSSEFVTVSGRGLVKAIAEGNSEIKVSARLGSASTSILFLARKKVPALTLPDELKIIDDEAFAGMKNFGDLVISTNVTKVGSRAFADCASLTRVTVMNPDAAIAADAFDGCAAGLTIYCKKDSTVWKQAEASGLTVKELK